MSEPDNFLSRWSRRKLGTERTDQERTATESAAGLSTDTKPAPGASGDVHAATGSVPVPTEKTEPEFDVSTLPSIDSIDIGTDIRSFLQKGVPLDLTRAALRRAWTADPAIRDFIEVAENQWDFAKGDIPGFGALESTDDVRRLVAEVFDGKFTEPPADEKAEPETERADAESAASADAAVDETSEETSKDVTDSPSTDVALTAPTVDVGNIVRPEEENIAAQQEPKHSDDALPNKRTHGRALPQ